MKKISIFLAIMLMLCMLAGCSEENLFDNEPGVMIDVPINQERADNQVESDERNFEDLSAALESAENSDEITNSIILNDMEFVFPCELSVLLINDWKIVGNDTQELYPQEDSNVVLQYGDSTVEVHVFNNDNENKVLKNCTIMGINCTLENNVSACLTNNIKLGDNLNDVKSSSIFADVQYEDANSCTFDRSNKVFIDGADEKVDYELKLSWNENDIISGIEMIVDFGV